MAPTAGYNRLFFQAGSQHKTQHFLACTVKIPFPAPSEHAGVGQKGCCAPISPWALGAPNTWAHPSSRCCKGHPAALVPAFLDVRWKEWLSLLLSRLKFQSWMPVLFMQNWHVSLSWAMWPRFQPVYLQNITHVCAPLSSSWFQWDYSHVHAYCDCAPDRSSRLCKAGVNPVAFSWFTPVWQR